MGSLDEDEEGSRQVPDLRVDESMTDPSELPVPGVTALDHTADIGLEIEAPSLPELFRRGALGAMWLVLEREPFEEAREERRGQDQEAGDSRAGPPSGPLEGSAGLMETRPLELAEADLPSLFRAWLRTLLFWEETEGFVVRETDFSFSPVPLCTTPDGQAFGLNARVRGVVDQGPRVREIKGVTLHQLRVERVGGGWSGRVIFDV